MIVNLKTEADLTISSYGNCKIHLDIEELTESDQVKYL